MRTQGVILLRLKDDSIENKIRVIENLLSNYSDKIKENLPKSSVLIVGTL